VAQLTGTQIVALARLLCQDTSTVSPAVTDAEALLLLNDVILRYNQDVEAKENLVSATTSGLTFPAGTVVVTTSADVGEILSAHPSDSASVNALQTPSLALWTVREMLDAHSDAGAGTTPQGASSEFSAFAWEKVQEGTESEKARVYVWPALNRTRYLTLRTVPPTTLSALTGTPPVDERGGRIIARFLAWEMGRLHTQDDGFLQQILAPIPQQVLEAYFKSAMKSAWLPSTVANSGALDA